MTAPVETPASIEHLDHKPMCGSEHHKPSVRADFWANAHDCEERLLCARCVSVLQSKARGMISTFGAFRCTHCARIFFSFDAFAQVRPL